ncbi:UDP-3-O-(3-hydroxymyristoyl)glucosamine N-acyltransferase [Cohnella cholangitidis]|nr:UDP-3-O-(3-hydroxymyristoyl)glucosamine N-acyltransferase [Cohnella cholangitidis]
MVAIDLKLSELLLFYKRMGVNFRESGNAEETERVIKGFSSIYETEPNTLSWMTAQRLDWPAIRASVVICSVNAELPENTDIVFIAVDKPKNAFALALREYGPKFTPHGISDTAVIGTNCEIGEDVSIGEYVVIGNGVKIGDRTRIHSHVAIHDKSTIGRDCIVHNGVVIGTEGFGYERNPDGTAFKIPHIGGVIIEDGVEIGSNSCVARGVLANTVIKKNTKIGNLTHISHNVTIGENTMITHLAHIGGKLIIENDCWIAPGSVYKQGLKIGQNSVTGLGAVVIRDVPPFDTVAGVPAKSIKKTSGE